MKKTSIMHFNGPKSINASLYENDKFIDRVAKESIVKYLTDMKETETLNITAIKGLNGKYKFILNDNDSKMKIIGVEVNDEYFSKLYNLANTKVNYAKAVPIACCIIATTAVLASPKIGPVVGNVYTNMKDAYVESENRYDDFERMGELSNKIRTIYGTSSDVYELENLVNKYSKVADLKQDQSEKLDIYQSALNECGPIIIDFERSKLTEEHRGYTR